MNVSFDLHSNFYDTDPQFPLIFKEELAENVPSKHMWALLLYTHPDSQYFNLDTKSKENLIRTDFLEDSSFDFTTYEATIAKIENFLLTKPQRLLRSWELKLEEREDFLKNIPYDATTFDMIDKMLEKSYKMWKQYKEIYDAFLKEEESRTQGDVQESLIETLSN